MKCTFYNILCLTQLHWDNICLIMTYFHLSETTPLVECPAVWAHPFTMKLEMFWILAAFQRWHNTGKPIRTEFISLFLSTSFLKAQKQKQAVEFWGINRLVEWTCRIWVLEWIHFVFVLNTMVNVRVAKGSKEEFFSSDTT